MPRDRVLILDGFVDEPSTLGVPPTISPYVRYLYGAAVEAMDLAWSDAGTLDPRCRSLPSLPSLSSPHSFSWFHPHPSRATPHSPSDRHGQGTDPPRIGYLTITGYRSLIRASRERPRLDAGGKRGGPGVRGDVSGSSPVTAVRELLSGFSIVVLVNHTPVPGNYLAGRPSSPRELQEIADAALENGSLVLSWRTPVRGAIHLRRDADAFLFDLLNGKGASAGGAIYVRTGRGTNPHPGEGTEPETCGGAGVKGTSGGTDGWQGTEAEGIVGAGDGAGGEKGTTDGHGGGGAGGVPGDRFRTPAEWNRWAVLGAGIIRLHPDFPDRLISEIDTLKGCVRYINGGCVFCTDPLEAFRMRSPDAILAEVKALVACGGKNIRLGGSCILSYQSAGIGETDRPVPDPGLLGELFRGIRSLLPPGGVFHTDNANPGIMAEHPGEAREALKVIIRYTTPGNSLSLGLESADPQVAERCHLNARAHEVAEAVRMINEVGRTRGENGMPGLLPGLNILYGLPGERPETHALNMRFLTSLREEGLLFRRINVRQLSPVRVRGSGPDRRFRHWKEEIRTTIDAPNLREVVPVGTVLRDVHIEAREGGNSFGRQVGTYPILVGIPFPVELHRRVDVRITGHGMRSVTGIPVPVDLDTASLRELSSLPGVGRKRAARIVRNRPVRGVTHLAEILDDRELAEALALFTGTGERD